MIVHIIDVTGLDDATVLAFHAAIAHIWATTPAEPTTRDAGQPGVRLRMHADLGQIVGEAFSPERARG
ncbi:DUF6207 family protein [Streptomyces sp. NPDC052415]|uniref:DUF6207 family protein n=1 Tax=Streptomyces sp. NPDC052415 TaxID=3365690 RepID=UPI0037D71E85